MSAMQASGDTSALEQSPFLKKGRTVPILFDGYEKGNMQPLESQPKIEQRSLDKIFEVIKFH